MKPLVKKQTVQSNGIQKSVSFGIKTSGLHHILGILRNQLYSDKIMAVVREYSCNAVDATIESSDKYGTDPNRAIEVTIPNKMNPNFKVRDYGVALSESEVQDPIKATVLNISEWMKTEQPYIQGTTAYEKMEDDERKSNHH